MRRLFPVLAVILMLALLGSPASYARRASGATRAGVTMADILAAANAPGPTGGAQINIPVPLPSPPDDLVFDTQRMIADRFAIPVPPGLDPGLYRLPASIVELCGPAGLPEGCPAGVRQAIADCEPNGCSGADLADALDADARDWLDGAMGCGGETVTAPTTPIDDGQRAALERFLAAGDGDRGSAPDASKIPDRLPGRFDADDLEALRSALNDALTDAGFETWDDFEVDEDAGTVTYRDEGLTVVARIRDGQAVTERRRDTTPADSVLHDITPYAPGGLTPAEESNPQPLRDEIALLFAPRRGAGRQLFPLAPRVVRDDTRVSMRVEDFPEPPEDSVIDDLLPPIPVRETPDLPAEDWEQRAAAGLLSIDAGGVIDRAMLEQTRRYMQDLHVDPAQVAMEQAAERLQLRILLEAAERQERQMAADAVALDARRRQASRDVERWKRIAERDGVWTAEELDVYESLQRRWTEVWTFTPAEEAALESQGTVRREVLDVIEASAVNMGGSSRADRIARERELVDWERRVRPYRRFLFTGQMVEQVQTSIFDQRELGIWAQNLVMAAELYLKQPDLDEERQRIARGILDRALLMRTAAAQAIALDIALIARGTRADVLTLGLGKPLSVFGQWVSRRLSPTLSRLLTGTSSTGRKATPVPIPAATAPPPAGPVRVPPPEAPPLSPGRTPPAERPFDADIFGIPPGRPAPTVRISPPTPRTNPDAAPTVILPAPGAGAATAPTVRIPPPGGSAATAPTVRLPPPGGSAATAPTVRMPAPAGPEAGATTVIDGSVRAAMGAGLNPAIRQVTARELARQAALARQAGVSEEVVAAILHRAGTGGGASAHAATFDLLRVRLTRLGFDLTMGRAEYLRLQELFVRGSRRALTPHDIEWIAARLRANPDYFLTLSRRGYVSTVDGFVPGLPDDAARTLEQAYRAAAGRSASAPVPGALAPPTGRPSPASAPAPAPAGGAPAPAATEGPLAREGRAAASQAASGVASPPSPREEAAARRQAARHVSTTGVPVAWLDCDRAGHLVAGTPFDKLIADALSAMDAEAGPLVAGVAISHGTSTGPGAFDLSLVSLGGPAFVAAEGLVLEPAPAAMAAAVLDAIAQVPDTRRVQVPLTAYCLDQPAAVPTKGQVYLVSEAAGQSRFADARLILRVAPGVRSALTPDSDPEAYFHSIVQWAVWTEEEGHDLEEFTTAFVDHTRKNLEAAGHAWTPDTEAIVKEVAPRRFADVGRVLDAANRAKAE